MTARSACFLLLKQQVVVLSDWPPRSMRPFAFTSTSDVDGDATLTTIDHTKQIFILFTSWCCPQIDHKKHLFAFGTLVKDSWMISHNHKQYQDMVYDYFNTGTTQGVKWPLDKGSAVRSSLSSSLKCRCGQTITR